MKAQHKQFQAAGIGLLVTAIVATGFFINKDKPQKIINSNSKVEPQPFVTVSKSSSASKKITIADTAVSLNKNDIKIKQADNDVTIKSIDPLVKITHDFSQSYTETNSYDIAKNDDINIQFVIWNKEPLSGVTVTIGDLPVNSTPSVKRVGFVAIKQKANNISNSLNPSDGKYPDPLLDGNAPFNISENSVTPVWISLHVPSTTAVSSLTIPVTFSGKLANNQQFIQEKNVTINIHNTIISSSDYPWYSNWLVIDIPNMGSTKKLKFINDNTDPVLFSNNYWNLISNIASFIHSKGQNVIILDPAKLASYSYNGNDIVVDLSAFDKMIDIFQKNGVIGRIEGGHFCGRPGGWGTNYVFHYVKKDANGKAVFADGNVDDPGVQQYYKVFLPALVNDLKQKNLYNIYYQHIADEPVDGNAASYLSALNFIKKIAPDIKTIDAIQTTKVADAITIPVPQLDIFANNLDFFEKEIASGKEVWMYTSWLPQGTFANRFIEQQALQNRLLFWILAKYNLKGTLNWGLNYWDNSDVYNQSGKPESGNRTKPAGDGFLVYPRNGSLYSSIRLETLKDGLEDYALLQKLKRQNPQLAAKIINDVVQKPDEYITSISAFRNAQKQLLNSVH